MPAANDGLRHRLLAILASDAADYSRLMATDDRGTVAALDDARRVFRDVVARHGGRVVDTAGDSVLAAFESAGGAVAAALAVQAQLGARTRDVPEARRLRFRIGIHLGDVIEKADGSVYGDGVNIAARLQALAEPGAIHVSGAVHAIVARRLAAAFDDLGERALKNVLEPLRVYRVRPDASASEADGARPGVADDAAVATGRAVERRRGRAHRAARLRTNLPATLVRLLGRDDDLAALGELVEQHRLVTIVGAGGIGKTLLAQHLLANRQRQYRHGVCWIGLGGLVDATAVPGAIAAALGLQPGGGGSLEGLARMIEPLEVLLALDNAEHLLGAVAEVAQSLHDRAPRLRLLVTSQAPLRLAAERVYRIGALSVPQGRLPAAEALSFGAVALFAERAQQVDARFVLSDANAPAVIELCRALDGLALAIELAAARAPTLGLKQLAASMHARLRLLGAGHNRSAPARQQTLRAALDWSHGLLEPREQAVFRRLGVLAGAADLALIQQVASDERHDEWAVIDALSLLVDRSLVTVLASHEAELPRYRLLDSPRAYALERLQAAGELQATRRRHAQAMAARFEAAWRDRFSGRIGVDSWRLGLEPDFDDAREAFEWARDQGDAALALAIGATLVLGMPRSNHAEVLALTDACEALLGADVPAPQTLAMRVALAWRWSDTRPQRALGAAREAVRVARSLGEADRFGLYYALTLCALTAATVEDHALAASALAEARTIEDRGWPAQRLLLAAEADYVVAIASGAEAAHCLQLARAQLALSQRAGYEGVAAELSIADAELMAGDAQSALRHGLAVLARLKGTRREAELALARLNIVASRLARDDTAEARALASVGWAQAQHLDQQAWWADYLSLLCALEARPRAAAKLAGYADATYRRHEDRRQPNESGAVERALALARSTLGADAVQRLVAEGALLRDDQVATLAFAMTDGAAVSQR